MQNISLTGLAFLTNNFSFAQILLKSFLKRNSCNNVYEIKYWFPLNMIGVESESILVPTLV